ncbi:hypothetical protein ACIXFK_17365 [Bacteroides fragilis]
MKTILESLKSVNAYPVPLRTIVEIAERRGLSLTSDATQAVLRGKDYKLATADLLLWLSLAPNISQGGQSYSFTDEQRQQFRNRANALFDEFGEETSSVQPTYGYKGSRL